MSSVCIPVPERFGAGGGHDETVAIPFLIDACRMGRIARGIAGVDFHAKSTPAIQWSQAPLFRSVPSRCGVRDGARRPDRAGRKGGAVQGAMTDANLLERIGERHIVLAGDTARPDRLDVDRTPPPTASSPVIARANASAVPE